MSVLKKVFVAGSTGVIGKRLVPMLLRQGHQVTALTRTSPGTPKFDFLDSLGSQCKPLTGDALNADFIREKFHELQPDVVINQLTAIPKEVRKPVDWEATNYLREFGTRILRIACEESKVKRLISQSVCFLYPFRKGKEDEEDLATEDQPLNEDTHPQFKANILALKALEKATLEGIEDADNADKLFGIVLRYGFLYGEGTAYDKGGQLYEDVKAKRFPLVGEGTGTFPLLHVEDAARAASICAGLEANKRIGGIFNICEERSPIVDQLVPFMAERIKAPQPARIPSFVMKFTESGRHINRIMNDQKAVDVKKAKNVLGFVCEKDWRTDLIISQTKE